MALGVLLGVTICGVYLFLFCAVAASPQATQSFLTLFGFIVACATALLVAIFFVGTKNYKNRSRFILGFFLLPALFFIFFFSKPVLRFFDERRSRLRIHDNYVESMKNREKDPRAAFLSCLLANLYEELDCLHALEYVDHASFCRTLCERQPNSVSKPLHPDCLTSEEIFLAARCAKFMVKKVNFDAPYDVCKAAGLLNFFSKGEYYQVYYYNCLKESVMVPQQPRGKAIEYRYKSLGELLKIRTEGKPLVTAFPLP